MWKEKWRATEESRKDDLITFEELGIDSIMVDEAHGFKNLAIFSKMNNVAGISSSGAKKSTDMQLKCPYIAELNGGRGIVFATGTPVSNTMCELYVMQLYLQKEALEQMGIYHFDSWAANFGEVTTGQLHDSFSEAYQSSGRKTSLCQRGLESKGCNTSYQCRICHYGRKCDICRVNRWRCKYA